GAEEPGRSAGAEEMSHVKVDRLERSAEAAFQMRLIVAREGGRHRARDFGIAAQVHDLPAHGRVRDEIASVGAPLDGAGSPAEAVLRAVLVDHGKPGLVEKLIEAGRARSARLG